MKIIQSYLFLALCLFSFSAPVEIGTVNWNRNYEEAVAIAKSTKKPIFLLFQEVPGCKGCQDFGKEVLSNPLIKKSIEEAFIPLMIRNNASSGHDLEILRKFKEPAWNYQVVRFIDANGKDLIPRKDRVWTTKALSERMLQALKKAKQNIPPSLKLVDLEEDTENHRSVAFAMYCFWTGEAELGKIPGVISTEAGWLDGKEVTLVKYHQKELNLKSLIKRAQEVKCAHSVYLPKNEISSIKDSSLRLGILDDSYRPAKKSDQKRQLIGTGINANRLTPAQLTKINAFIRSDQNQARLYL